MFTSKHLVNYCAATTVYGFVRRTYQVKDASIEVFDKKTNKVKHTPMLLVDKAINIITSSAVAPILFPFLLYQDLAWWEIVLTRNPEEYYA